MSCFAGTASLRVVKVLLHSAVERCRGAILLGMKCAFLNGDILGMGA